MIDVKAGTLLSLTLVILAWGCKSGSTDASIGKDRTESASKIAGWKEIATSGFALSFPADWEPMDITGTQLKRNAEKLGSNDPETNRKKAEIKTAVDKNQIKLFVKAVAKSPSGFTPIADVVVTDTGGRTLDRCAADNAKFLERNSPTGTNISTTDFQTSAGRAIKLVHPHLTAKNQAVTSILYLQVKDRQLYVVAFTASQTDAAEIEGIADQSMKSFRFTGS